MHTTHTHSIHTATTHSHTTRMRSRGFFHPQLLLFVCLATFSTQTSDVGLSAPIIVVFCLLPYLCYNLVVFNCLVLQVLSSRQSICNCINCSILIRHSTMGALRRRLDRQEATGSEPIDSAVGSQSAHLRLNFFSNRFKLAHCLWQSLQQP